MAALWSEESLLYSREGGRLPGLRLAFAAAAHASIGLGRQGISTRSAAYPGAMRPRRSPLSKSCAPPRVCSLGYADRVHRAVGFVILALVSSVPLLAAESAPLSVAWGIEKTKATPARSATPMGQ